ncbi:MAG: hypothetical protein LH461_01200 [Spirochaetaceae bacterium]|nr:hypothetical protein [Spirochaetaceae bacterium]
MRVYLPMTLPALAAALEVGAVESPIGYAVTPALREWYIEGDSEELEYAAAAAAARASLRRLAGEASGGSDPRRVVVAADVPDRAARPAPDIDRAAVRLGDSVDITLVVSALVDDPDAVDDVRRGVAALPAADAGDEDASFAVDSVEDHELAWYAAQELAALVEIES